MTDYGHEAVHVKICGLTNLDDALRAVEAGADYLGFNFYPRSSRCIAPAGCRHICDELRRRGATVRAVGVFVNVPPAEVAAMLDCCGLDLAQLHGDEPAQAGQQAWLKGRAFRAVHAPGAADLPALAALSPGRPAFLVDAHVAGRYGGTGQLADWEAARAAAQAYPIFLAGGLTPSNARAAVEQVRPWGVDVASGVEREPGKKDYALMRAFVAALR
jgi:phosphoribosylanthranilate isomerase